MKGQMIKKKIVIISFFSFHRITQKIMPPNLGPFNIIFKNLNVWGKFQPHYEDRSYFTKYNDLSFLAMTADKLFTQLKINIKTVFVDFNSFYITPSEMYFIPFCLLKLIIYNHHFIDDLESL